MVLYEAVSTYHLLNAIIDRMNNLSEQAVLLVSNGLLRKYEDGTLLRLLFKKIIPYDIHIATHLDDEHLKEHFYHLTKLSEKENPYSKIICGCPIHSFGYFLAISNIPFIFCEDGAGLLSRPFILIDINASIPIRQKINDRYLSLGLYDASNPNITAVRCNRKAQLPQFRFEDYVIQDFDTVAELSALSEKQRHQIFQFFTSPVSLEASRGAVLLLTQHFANLQALSFDEQALLYQMAVDYFFCRDKLVIKPHPDDLMYYHHLFPEAQIIRERFPSEFLPFILDNQPDCVATISSTAIFNLRGHYPRVFELDTHYEKDFPMTHRYYAAVTLAQRLGLPIVCEGANEVLAQRLCETLDGHGPAVSVCGDRPDGACLLLVDDVTGQGEAGRARVRTLLDGLSSGSCAVLLNTQGDFCWYDYDRRELWNHMAPVTLQKRRMGAESEDFYASLEEETVYIYSQDKELLDMAKETRIEKELPHTGLQVSRATFTTEQERIKMLEGILAATERRLLYYIEKERNEK